MTEAEPVRQGTVKRELSECRFCGDLIFRTEWSREWKHNRNGARRCDGTVPTFEERQAAAKAAQD